MKKLFLFIALSVGIFSFNQASASHAAGGEILYELVPNTTNTYKFIFKFYRDCDGINAPGSVNMCYNSGCANPLTGSLTLNQIPNTGGSVSSSCPGFNNSCDTNWSGALPGYEEWIYENTMTLNQQCNAWRFWVSIGARNNMDWLTNGTAGSNLYIEATFNNTVFQNDNSPYFSVKPVPYCCVGQQFNFNNGAVDVNGDSLVFTSIQPRSFTTACPGTGLPAVCNYQNFGAQVASPTLNPIPTNNTFVLNQNSGSMSFTPTAAGDGVITILCESYRNGQFLGSVMRDIQVVVLQNCPLVPQSPNIDSNTVVGLYVDSSQVNVCLGDSVSFCGLITSTDSTAVLKAFDNALLSIPNATITYTGLETDTIEFCFNWQTTFLDTGLHVISITYLDSSCKPPGILLPQVKTFSIFVDYATAAAGDTTICLGDSTQLSAIGGGPYTWAVLPGGSPITSLSCLNCDNPWVTPTVPTFYTVSGCTTDTVFVDVVTGPTPSITPDTTTCVNSSLQLQVVANPPNQSYNYNWSPGTLLNDSTIANPVFTNPTTTTTFTVVITPQGFQACQSTAQVTVTVLQGFTIDPYDTIICDGESTNITGSGDAAYSYAWTPPGDLTSTNTIPTTITPAVPGGSYTITASFPGCPDSVITIPVIVDPNPVVDAGSDRAMCLNDSVHLNSSAMPNNIPYTISWTPSADLDGADIPNPVFDGATSTILTVTYTTPNGCPGSDDVTVVVNNVNFLQLDGDRSICPGDTTSLSVLGGDSYFWYPDSYISGVGNVTSVTVYPEVPTYYYVVGVDQNGCVDTAKAYVRIEQGSVIDAGDDVTIYPGETVQLIAKGNCSYFNWFPPSGLSSTTVMNPTASPTATTKYVVNAQTENGCPTVDSVTVRVSPESLLDLPNAFTPGSGTSINDMLKLRKRGIVTLDNWQMFNRWGELVFSTKDIDAGWDGRFQGKVQPMGTYVFFLEATTSTGKKFYKQGNVTLIR